MEFTVRPWQSPSSAGRLAACLTSRETSGESIGMLCGCSSHPGVSKVAFTGSVATGRRVNVAAAANLRPTTMELGGKSALIVFEDADVADAVEWAMVSPPPSPLTSTHAHNVSAIT